MTGYKVEINLLKYNPHWEESYAYPYPKKRQDFSVLLKYLSRRQIVELTGLRRVGKSTLLFQLIDHQISLKINPFHLFYFTFDDVQPSLDELFDQYQKQTAIDFKKIKLTLFLDEIQKLPNFQNQIKVYYDLYPNLKFVISGSTSLFIRKKSQESLAGRTITHRLLPLSYPEYLMFRGKDRLLIKPILYKQTLDREFALFLKSQLIESIAFSSDRERKEYYLTILKKVVYEDLPSVFSIDNPSLVYRIIQIIAQNPGAIINNLHLAQELGLSNKTIALYLGYLEDVLLIRKFYNFSRNLTTSEKRFKKYYLASPSFSFALTDFINESLLFENYYASLTSARYFYRDVNGHEVDFVNIGQDQRIIPVEIKNKKRIDKSDYRNLILFMNKFQIKEGFIYCRTDEKSTVAVDKRKISLLPFYLDLEF